MAAPVSKALQLTFGCVMSKNGVWQTSVLPCCTIFRRWKKMNNKRPKAPHVQTEKKEWMPKQKKQIVVETKKKLDPDFLNKKILDDVWIREYYPEQSHTLAHALSMHTELAHPQMTNNMNGIIYLDLILDLTTKKKTKFIKNVGNIIELPHHFKYGKPSRIMIIAQTEEEIQRAKELGAVFYGGDDLIKMIENGAVLKDEFDYVIATPEMMKSVNKLRYFFKDKTPIKNTGNLTKDLEKAFRLFNNGIAYSLTPTSDEAVGKLRFPLGPLKLSEQSLLENGSAFISHLCTHKTSDVASFITEARCICPPSVENFKVDLLEYMPKTTRQTSQTDEDTDDDVTEAEALSQKQ